MPDVSNPRPGNLQTIIISKEKAKTVDEAKRIAKEVGATHLEPDEKADSWHFRQRNPSDFNSGGYGSKALPNGATLVYGTLKASEDGIKRFHGVPQEIQLSEKVPSEIQLLKVGNFHDVRYGDFPVTPEMLLSMVSNFKNKVRGIDLSLDYEHQTDGKSAAWFKDVYTKDNGTTLWAKVEWTPSGEKTLSDKEYRYISADFSNDFMNNETKKTYGPTLNGAALTNRPVIKGMEPVVQLTEIQLNDNEKLHKDLESRSKQYGIEVTNDASLTPPSGSPSDASAYGDPVNFKFPINDSAHASNARVRFKQGANTIYKDPHSRNVVHERIVRKELEFGSKPSFDSNDPLDSALPSDLKAKLEKPKQNSEGGIMDPKDQEIADLKKKVADLEAQMQKEAAAEGDQAVQAKMADMQKQLDDYKAKESAMAAEKVMAEQKSKFDKMLSEGKVVEAQRVPFMANDMGKFTELAQPLKLSEIGNGGAGGSDEAPEIEITKLAQVKLSEKKASDIGEATRMVLAEKPELAKKYYEKNQPKQENK